MRNQIKFFRHEIHFKLQHICNNIQLETIPITSQGIIQGFVHVCIGFFPYASRIDAFCFED